MGKEEQKGGIGNEPWWKSRRVKSAILSAAVAVAVVLAPDQYDLILAVGSFAAGAFGVTSWVKPKPQ